jgi:diguanylate cyclase (GGDEF)-like protein
VSDSAPDELLRAGLEAVAATLRSGRRPELPPPLASDAELGRLLDELVSLNRFVLAVGSGDLEQRLEMRGNVAGALKSLQASLRHLTWQTQRVAEGDFSQRVDFMGEFSSAFNSMVVALEQARAELAELATHDALTGVFNRRKFNELIALEIERVGRYGSLLSFIIIDIDHFKRVNDTLGHEAGDAVLVSLAAVLRACVRAVDSVARWGGEEFVLLLPQVGVDGAAELAARICAAVRDDRLLGGITVSCGVAELRPPESPDGLFARADRALYRAKEGGRDRVEVAD